MYSWNFYMSWHHLKYEKIYINMEVPHLSWKNMNIWQCWVQYITWQQLDGAVKTDSLRRIVFFLICLSFLLSCYLMYSIVWPACTTGIWIRNTDQGFSLCLSLFNVCGSFYFILYHFSVRNNLLNLVIILKDSWRTKIFPWCG